eukprot:EG_transcript_20570
MLQEHDLRGPLTIKGRRIEPKLALPRGQVAPRRGQQTHAGHPSGGTRIFACRIPPTLGQDEVRAYFEQFGALSDFYMPLIFETKQPRGIAFITYLSPESVDSVMQVSHELGGRQIAVDRATPKPEDQFWPSFNPWNASQAYGRYPAAGLAWGAPGPGSAFAPPYRLQGAGGPVPRAPYRPRPYHPYASPYALTAELGMGNRPPY